MPVDVKRAPFPSAASPLSAAISDTLNPRVIRPYPPRHLFFTYKGPIPSKWNLPVSDEYSIAKKHIAHAEREIVVPVYGHYDF
jgi:hypothetical protein